MLDGSNGVAMGQVVKIDEKAWIKNLLGEMFRGAVEGTPKA